METDDSPLSAKDHGAVGITAASEAGSAAAVEVTPMSVRLPVGGRERWATPAGVILADFSIYRTLGFAGIGVFTAGVVVLLLLAARDAHRDRRTLLIAVLMVPLVLRFLWEGNLLAVVMALGLLGALAANLAGWTPSLGTAVEVYWRMLSSGLHGMADFLTPRDSLSRHARRTRSLGGFVKYGMPAIMAALFAMIFVMANPEIRDSLSYHWRMFRHSFFQWFDWPEIDRWRLAFWTGMLVAMIGLLRPTRRTLLQLIPASFREDFRDNAGPYRGGYYSSSGTAGSDDDGALPAMVYRDIPFLPKLDLKDLGRMVIGPLTPDILYPAYRNTLVTLIALFSGYLVFEFYELATRVFPPGFYYSGYAHEGAAWLTVALAVATVVLSVMFHGRMREDARMPRLRRWAMMWAVLNLLLAVAVYKRLGIYVGFNGMTYMRVVGFLGISAVVAGFILVVIKTWRNWSFSTLIQTQLLALAGAIYLLAVLPVDGYVNRYNVRRIMGGDLPPSVQISHHPVTAEGQLELFPLLECPVPEIRQGVAAMLAGAHDTSFLQAESDVRYGIPYRGPWQQWQGARARLSRLAAENSAVQAVTKPDRGSSPEFQAFVSYTHQWY